MKKTYAVLALAVMFLASLPCQAAEPLKTPTAAPAALEANADDLFAPCSEPCNGTCRSKCERFKAWLFYQPLDRGGLCNCFKKCNPYCTPPLYAFFPCQPCAGSGCYAAAATHETPAECSCCDHQAGRIVTQKVKAGPIKEDSKAVMTWEAPAQPAK